MVDFDTRTLVTGAGSTQAVPRHRIPVNDGPSNGTRLSRIIERKGALRVGTAAAVGRALVSRILEAHVARGVHGALSASRVFVDVGEGSVSVSVEGLTATSTSHAPKVARVADVRAIGEILLVCLLGEDTSDAAVQRAKAVAPARAAALVAIALEARDGSVESAEELSLRLSVWEHTFDGASRPAAAA